MQNEYALLITLGALLIVNPMLRGFCFRIGLPALVGYIILGFLVGLANQRWSFATTAFNDAFYILAQMGVVALLFRVGLKSHTSALLAKLPMASVLWVGDVATNLLVGFAVARYGLALSVETSLVIATAFSATSVAVALGVWEEVGKLNTDNGQLLLDVAELDDLSGILLLAVLLAVLPTLNSGGELLPGMSATVFDMLLKLALFVTACYLFAHFLEARFTRFSRTAGGSLTALTITILGAGLVISAIAGSLGFSLAIGALFAGLAFSRDPQIVRTDGRFGYFYEFLTPFFFIYIGMQVDPDVIFTSLDTGLILALAAASAKFVGVAGPALLALGKHPALLLGVSMIPRAEIALVIVHQCHQLNQEYVSAEVFAAMVVVALATSLLAPLPLRRLLARKAK